MKLRYRDRHLVHIALDLVKAALQNMYSPRADSFLVLIILAAYSCPVEIFMHLLTTEKAPLQES